MSTEPDSTEPRGAGPRTPRGQAGSAPGPGLQPHSLRELIAALSLLDSLDDVERARVIPGLIEATKGVLARERASAMLAAEAAGVSRADLARLLGRSRSKVTKAITKFGGS